MLPDAVLEPEDEFVAPQDEAETPAHRVERALEAVLIAVVVVLASYLGTSEVLRALKDGALSLASVFYPLIVIAMGSLALSRRTFL